MFEKIEDKVLSFETYRYTQRNNPVSLQHEHFFNLREDFVGSLRDFTCRLLAVIVQNVELTVQDVETKVNPANLTGFFL